MNNAAYLGYLDDARFTLFPSMGVDETGALTASMLVVVKHEIEYLAALTYRPAPFAVEVWVPRIGRSSVDFAYEILDAANPETVYLRARSRMVQLDTATHAARAFTTEERAAFESHRGASPELRSW